MKAAAYGAGAGAGRTVGGRARRLRRVQVESGDSLPIVELSTQGIAQSRGRVRSSLSKAASARHGRQQAARRVADRVAVV